MSIRNTSLGAMVAAVFSLTLLLALPVVSQAGVAIVWPDSFSVVDSADEVVKAPDGMRATGATTNAEFVAPVNIPIGRTITRLAYFHLGYNTASGTTVTLYRIWLGKEAEEMASASSTDDTGTIITVVDTTIDTPVVAPGYRYFVKAKSVDSDAAILGVRIIFVP